MTTLTMETTRACARCGVVKPRTGEHFHKAARMADGLSSWCKTCSVEYTRLRVQASPEQNRARVTTWQEQNPERRRERVRQWRHSNPEANRVIVQRRRARQRGAQGVCTPQQWTWRVEFYGGLCYLCRAPWEAMDHVKPLSKGGSNWPANLRPICGSCNSRKGAKSLVS